jgi:hypothetical protein
VQTFRGREHGASTASEHKPEGFQELSSGWFQDRHVCLLDGLMRRSFRMRRLVLTLLESLINAREASVREAQAPFSSPFTSANRGTAR